MGAAAAARGRRFVFTHQRPVLIGVKVGALFVDFDANVDEP